MKLKVKRDKRSLRVRFSVKSKSLGKLRVSAFKSNHHLYLQLIDDIKGETLAHASTLSPEIKSVLNGKLNKNAGRLVGELFAKKCAGFEGSGFVFDRGGNSYTGIISECVGAMRDLGFRI